MPTHSLARPALVVAAAWLAACAPQQTDPAAEKLNFHKLVVAVEMRDGVHLNTEIYTPQDAEQPLPILITRTPYGLGHDDAGMHTSLAGAYAELAADGYIFVFQDIRGRYDSEGEFVMLRPPRHKDSEADSGEALAVGEGPAIDEATDTSDTIDWLLEHVEGHNGRVGMLGISYGGWLTAMAMLDPHPALRAASPQASPADMFLGDDFLHNGAFRLAPSFGYVALMESGKTNQPFPFDQHDVYEWYLDLGPLRNADERYFQGERPTWNLFMANPDYSEAWRRLSVLTELDQVHVPMLHVAGWWDAEDLFGPLAIYAGLEQHDSDAQSSLVVGPWRHGGWARGDGDSLGEIQFGSATALYYRERLQRSFFAAHLKEDQPWRGAEATVFETGANVWRELDQWPPEGRTVELYVHSNGELGWDRPGAADSTDRAYDEYLSDPAKPVPYMPRPIPGFWQGGQALWKVTDQRFADGRPDVLTWSTAALDEDVLVCGPIEAELHASTTGTGADWVVKLIDVYPEDYPDRPEMGGFQLMIADEVLRGRFRNSFEQPEPIPANEVVPYTIGLGERCHRFVSGHAIMVQVQSTWFPLIGRNPQTAVSIPEANADDYRTATHRIHRSPTHPTHLRLHVVEAPPVQQ